MRVGIARQGENIVTVKEYTDIQDRGEISHFIAELEIIKLDLLEMFQEWEDEEN